MGVSQQKMRQKGGGVSLGRGRVPEAQAVNQNRGVLDAQASGSNGGLGAGSAQLLNAQAGNRPQGLDHAGFSAFLQFRPADDRQGLRHLLCRLWIPGGRDHDFLPSNRQLQHNVPHQILTCLNLKTAQGQGSKTPGLNLQEVFRRPQRPKTETSRGIGGDSQAQAAGTVMEGNQGVGHKGLLGIGNRPADRGRFNRLGGQGGAAGDEAQGHHQFSGRERHLAGPFSSPKEVFRKLPRAGLLTCGLKGSTLRAFPPCGSGIQTDFVAAYSCQHAFFTGGERHQGASSEKASLA